MSKSHLHTSGGNSPTYQSWRKMKERALNPNAINSERYSHVDICDSWLSFENFLADMGERPEGMTLDRIDGTRGYSKDNCRWATPTEQSRNRKNVVLSVETAEYLRKLYAEGLRPKAISEMTGIALHNVSNAVYRNSWA